MTDISFRVAGVELRGKLFRQQISGANAAILFLHGWTSRQDRYFELADTLAAQGYVCLTFDMRGHGASDGELKALTRVDFLDDAVAAYDLLANTEGVDKARISVVGSSFGSYIATLLSAKRPCAALCLRVPANYPDTGFEEPHLERANAYYEGVVEEDKKRWKTTVHSFSETSSLRAVHAFGGPILLVESEKDELVPHEIVQSYIDAAPDKNKLTYVFMRGAPHSLNGSDTYKEEFKNILVSWLSERQ